MTIVIVATAWAGHDARAAADWVKQLPKHGLRDQVLNRVIERMAARDPSVASDLTGSLGGGSRASRLLTEIFTEWETKDPVVAAAKVASLDSVRSRALTRHRVLVVREGSVGGARMGPIPPRACRWTSCLVHHFREPGPERPFGCPGSRSGDAGGT